MLLFLLDIIEVMTMSTTTIVVLVLSVVGYFIYLFVRWLSTPVPLHSVIGGGLLGSSLAESLQETERSLHESNIRDARASKLRHLKRDLEQTEELMRLEQKAHELREQYEKDGRKGRKYSPELEELFRKAREDVERMKRG
jgi:hypothetical protein